MSGHPSAEDLNVSRETFERLEQFASILKKWNPKINLVSRTSLRDLWTRHIADSIQVFRAVDPGLHWVDIGSGGGLPGVIVAILAAEKSPETKVTMIESDQRKCAFLRTAARECGVKCDVISERIEKVAAQDADILSARALADLDMLLGFADLHLHKNGTAVFPKGANWKKEVELARLNWNFDLDVLKSLTETEAALLKIRRIERV